MKKVLSFKRLLFHTLMTIVMLKAAATAPLFLTLHVRYVMVFCCVPSFSPSIPFHPIPLPFGVGVGVVGGGGCTHFPLHLVPPLPLLLCLSPPPPPNPLHSRPHYFHPPPPPQCSFYSPILLPFYSPISLQYPPPPPHFTVILALRHNSSPLFIRTCDSKLPYTVTPVLCNHPWDATKTSVSHMASVFTDSTRRGEIWPFLMQRHCDSHQTGRNENHAKLSQLFYQQYVSAILTECDLHPPPPPPPSFLFVGKCLLLWNCFHSPDCIYVSYLFMFLNVTVITIYFMWYVTVIKYYIYIYI